MSRARRVELIQQIQDLRKSKVIVYITTLRPNVPGMMSDDAVRIMADHLLKLDKRPVDRLDLFLCSNGGSGTLPWRLVSLFREFAKQFCVILPFRAYSAASLLALGADEIVMHPFAEMGPIDPTVTNEFNPIDPGTGRKLGVSVEDVKAYINFVKNTVGIRHEDELIKALEVLADKVHPLALGNVERFLSQSRMIARKIMMTHMHDENPHQIEEIIETMASKLYFHGHPISRAEAKNDLRLKVNAELQPELETIIWKLFEQHEILLEHKNRFLPTADLMGRFDAAVAAAAGGQINLNQVRATYKLIHAIIECTELSSCYVSERNYCIAGINNGVPQFREDVMFERWDQS